MKRGYPFQEKKLPASPQQIEVNVTLDQENLRNCYVVAQRVGKDATAIANTVMRIGFLRVQLKRLEEGFIMEVMAAEARAMAEAAAPAEKPKDDEDPMTPEERLEENRRIARGEA